MINVTLIHGAKGRKTLMLAPVFRRLGCRILPVKPAYTVIAGGSSVVVVAADRATIRIGGKETCAKAQSVGGEALR